MRALLPHETYVCRNGCGECKARRTERWYSREEKPDGTVVELKEPVIVSSCCGGEVEIWDEQLQRTLDEAVMP